MIYDLTDESMSIRTWSTDAIVVLALSVFLALLFCVFFIWIISLIAGPLAWVPLIAVPIVIFAGLVIQPFLASHKTI